MSVSVRLYNELKGDRVIWLILFLLALFSTLVVYSSTGSLAYLKYGGNQTLLLVKHFTFITVGIVVAYVCHLLHYMKFSKWAPYLLLAAVPLLFYTLFFGAEINDARRWIMIPFTNQTFQTSDFAKLTLIIYVARSISTRQNHIDDFKSAFVPIILPVAIICALIAPADLSSAILLFITCTLMMVVGRVSLKYILAMLISGLFVFSLLIALGNIFPDFIRSETWASRIQEFRFDQDGGYQIQQAKIAIAQGETIGVGPGNSTQRNFLPASYSDFIYAIICEEYGLIGGLFIIGLYILLLLRCVKLVTKSPKTFGAMLAIGVGMSLVIQALCNIAVSVHILPVTGLTLPMVSMGGTSVLFTCIAFGILLSVSKYIEKSG